MVEDRITDGERIAELLASEVTGLAVEPFDAVAVVDADRDATPSPEGTFAYRIAVDDEPIGSVFLHPDHARVDLSVPLAADVGDAAVGVERTETETTLRIPSGAAVKPARDLIAAAVAAVE